MNWFQRQAGRLDRWVEKNFGSRPEDQIAMPSEGEDVEPGEDKTPDCTISKYECSKQCHRFTFELTTRSGQVLIPWVAVKSVKRVPASKRLEFEFYDGEVWDESTALLREWFDSSHVVPTKSHGVSAQESAVATIKILGSMGRTIEIWGYSGVTSNRGYLNLPDLDYGQNSLLTYKGSVYYTDMRVTKPAVETPAEDQTTCPAEEPPASFPAV